MKIIYCFIFLVSILPSVLLAESSGSAKIFPYTFSVASSVGFLYGHGEEIVYKNSDDDVYLSQLLWDMKPLFYIGTSLNFSRIDPMKQWGFFADFSFKFGVPSKTGGMEDRDWVAANGALTHFSSHDNYTNEVLLVNFSEGFSLPILSKVLLLLYGNFSYMYFSWASENGYTQYTKKLSDGVYEPWDPSIPKVNYYGPAINYIQEWFLISPGISLFIPFQRFFSGTISFQCSPFILCIAHDKHLARNLQFIDYVNGGIFLEPKGEFTFSPHAKINLTVSVGYQYIGGSKGTSYSKNIGTSAAYTNAGTAGTGYSALDVGLSVKIRF